MVDDDISIKYVNNTQNTDFDVMVFTKNYSTRTPKTYYVAWHILRGQSSVSFTYPVNIAVGATYQDKGLSIVAGPFIAQLGSSWTIVQAQTSDTAVLKQVTGIVDNPDGTIVVQNKPPRAWNGRKFDVGIYKDGKLLITQQEVHVGDQVDFMLQPRLYFAVCRNVTVGDIFTSLEITSYMKEFDLANYPHGMQVTLNEAAGGGKYTFSAVNMNL